MCHLPSWWIEILVVLDDCAVPQAVQTTLATGSAEPAIDSASRCRRGAGGGASESRPSRPSTRRRGSSRTPSLQRATPRSRRPSPQRSDARPPVLHSKPSSRRSPSRSDHRPRHRMPAVPRYSWRTNHPSGGDMVIGPSTSTSSDSPATSSPAREPQRSGVRRTTALFPFPTSPSSRGTPTGPSPPWRSATSTPRSARASCSIDVAQPAALRSDDADDVDQDFPLNRAATLSGFVIDTVRITAGVVDSVITS